MEDPPHYNANALNGQPYDLLRPRESIAEDMGIPTVGNAPPRRWRGAYRKAVEPTRPTTLVRGLLRFGLRASMVMFPPIYSDDMPYYALLRR